MGIWGGVFAVPNSLIDNYIKIATGDNLKVLLYCLRYTGQVLSVGEISRSTGIAPDNVTTSIAFWEQRLKDEAFIKDINATQSTYQQPTAIKDENVKASVELLERDYDYSPKEISDIIKSNSDVDYLFKRCEELYGRLLKHNEQKALAVIIEDVGMNPEVALMLIVYCFSIGKTTTGYIKKLAKRWIEQGVDSHELADERIKRLTEYNSVEGELKRLLEIKAIPDAQKPLFEKWLYEYGFSVEIIYLAYQKTLEKTGKLQYTFMDKVLTGLKEGVSVLTEDGKIEFASGVKNAKNKPDNNKTIAGVKPAKTRVSDTPSFNLDELDEQIMEEMKKMSVKKG